MAVPVGVCLLPLDITSPTDSGLLHGPAHDTPSAAAATVVGAATRPIPATPWEVLGAVVVATP